MITEQDCREWRVWGCEGCARVQGFISPGKWCFAAHWGVFQLWFSFSAGLKSVGSSSPASHFFSQASFAGLLLPNDLRPKLVKFEFFSFFHGLELFYCNSLQVRNVTTNTFFDADSNKIVFRLDFFGPSEQFGFEASNSTKIPIVFGHFCFFC